MESKIDKWIKYCNENDIRMVEHESNFYFCTSDIGKKLDIKNIRSTIYSLDNTKKNYFLVKTKTGMKKASFLSYIGCIELLSKTKSIISEDIFKIIGYESVHSIKLVSIESKTIGFIKRCFQDEEMIQQFSVGTYRIDLYFPKYKIAIECDEKSVHTRDKHLEYDKERQDFIVSELGCTFIRYRPEEDEMELADVIYKIRNKIIEF